MLTAERRCFGGDGGGGEVGVRMVNRLQPIRNKVKERGSRKNEGFLLSIVDAGRNPAATHYCRCEGGRDFAQLGGESEALRLSANCSGQLSRGSNISRTEDIAIRCIGI